MMAELRIVGPPILALLTVLAIEHLTARRGLTPPGTRVFPGDGSQRVVIALLRRLSIVLLLWAVLWIGVFAPLGALGLDHQPDLAGLSIPQLFLLHLLFVVCLVLWYPLGFVGARGSCARDPSSWVSQLGLRTSGVAHELGIGLLAGIAAWLVVLGALISVGLLIWWLGGEELLPKQPPALIPWVAALPIWVRVAVSFSAGVVEETFFRGLLQPRVGVTLSTLLFVLAHASYEQPLMLVGITLLSLIYAGLVHWRQTIWPAIAAHVLFDMVQLLVVIPAALEMLPDEGRGVLVPVAFWNVKLWSFVGA